MGTVTANWLVNDWSFFYTLPPQSAGFDVPGITKIVNDTLANPDCANFVSTILNKVSSKSNPVYPAGGGLGDVFNAFLHQKKPHDLFTRNPPPGNAGYGGVSGTLKGGNAQIYSLGGYDNQTLFDANATLSELFHHAGSNGYYTDKELATALSQSSYAALAYTSVYPESPGAPMMIRPELNVFDSRYKPQRGWTKENELAYSAYFHTIQRNVCHILPGKASL